jgi:general L-amino acid transport system substrate-binding protein
MSKQLIAAAVAAAIAVTSTVAFAQSSPTLDAIKARGHLLCGVTEGQPGFSLPDANNEWSGLDVDYCRALAAAIFNDPMAVRVVPTTSSDRFTVLGAGDIDVLARTVTWTMTRDISLGIMFAAVLYYDGQGFIVRKADGIAAPTDLGGAVVCIEAGTTTELNAADYFAANNVDAEILTFVGQNEALKAFEDGRCDAFTTDGAQLAGNRLEFGVPDDYTILPQVISKEPLSSVVRQGDDVFFQLARWTAYAMLNAEELGVTQANVDEMVGSDSPEIKRLLGVEGDFGTPLGVSKDWALQIIKHVGNYADMYERNLGTSTPIGLARGINALWNDGGIMYAPPIR